jgi:hypothetical protein
MQLLELISQLVVVSNHVLVVICIDSNPAFRDFQFQISSSLDNFPQQNEHATLYYDSHCHLNKSTSRNKNEASSGAEFLTIDKPFQGHNKVGCFGLLHPANPWILYALRPPLISLCHFDRSTGSLDSFKLRVTIWFNRSAADFQTETSRAT